MATGTINALPYVKYCENTGDVNTFANGVTLVTTSALNTASENERCVIFTATLLTNPIRKVQLEITMSGAIYTRYNTGSWTAWVQRQQKFEPIKLMASGTIKTNYAIIEGTLADTLNASVNVPYPNGYSVDNSVVGNLMFELATSTWINTFYNGVNFGDVVLFANTISVGVKNNTALGHKFKLIIYKQ